MLVVGKIKKMNLKFSNSGLPADQQKIKEFEDLTNSKLPSDFYDFLLKFNGTEIYPNFILVEYPDFLGWREIVPLNKLWSIEEIIKAIDYQSSIAELTDHFEQPKEYVESKYLYWIGEFIGTSLAISVGGLHKGKVYHVDNGDFGVALIANSFTEFLNNLFDYEAYDFPVSYWNEFRESVTNNNIDLVKEYVELKNGIEFIHFHGGFEKEIAWIMVKNKFTKMIEYFISKGFKQEVLNHYHQYV